MEIKRILESLVPFILLGIAIAVAISLLFMFFSVAIWGLVIGGVLWLIALAKNYLFPSKPLNKEEHGRIIEHDDKK